MEHLIFHAKAKLYSPIKDVKKQLLHSDDANLFNMHGAKSLYTIPKNLDLHGLLLLVT